MADIKKRAEARFSFLYITDIRYRGDDHGGDQHPRQGDGDFSYIFIVSEHRLLLSYICFFGLGGILATRMLRMLWASTRPLRLML